MKLVFTICHASWFNKICQQQMLHKSHNGLKLQMASSNQTITIMIINYTSSAIVLLKSVKFNQSIRNYFIKATFIR